MWHCSAAAAAIDRSRRTPRRRSRAPAPTVRGEPSSNPGIIVLPKQSPIPLNLLSSRRPETSHRRRRRPRFHCIVSVVPLFFLFTVHAHFFSLCNISPPRRPRPRTPPPSEGNNRCTRCDFPRISAFRSSVLLHIPRCSPPSLTHSHPSSMLTLYVTPHRGPIELAALSLMKGRRRRSRESATSMHSPTTTSTSHSYSLVHSSRSPLYTREFVPCTVSISPAFLFLSLWHHINLCVVSSAVFFPILVPVYRVCYQASHLCLSVCLCHIVSLVFGAEELSSPHPPSHSCPRSRFLWRLPDSFRL